MSADEGPIGEAARALREARAVTVLTGAGISAESGVPTFRGPGGLWRSYRSEDLATPEAFESDPALVWEWYRWRRARMATALPNPGHVALARLEARAGAFMLVTQNVDGLHAKADNRRLLELHGNIWRDRCSADPTHPAFDAEPEAGAQGASRARLPRCRCGALLRPDVVWFGEALDPAIVDAAVEAVSAAEVLLVVGTSSVVYPAAGLPALARRSGALVVEINPEETPLSREAHLVLRGAAGAILPQLEALSR